MSGLLVRDLPDELHRLLRGRATANRRSLSSEVITLLSECLAEPDSTPPELPGLSGRKSDHIRICLEEEIESGTTGAGSYRLETESFPEMSLEDVDTSATFLGYQLAFPFVIASMSGGLGGELRLNEKLAEAAREAKCALALGSMRPALEDPPLASEYSVRRLAPGVPLLGNISAWQLREADFADRLLELVAELDLDGLFVHVNAAQELVQPEGERDFGGALDAVCEFAARSDRPVLLKEVGAGLTTGHLARLLDAGITGIDVAGGGGTDFARVEARRTEDPVAQRLGSELHELYVPTAKALLRTVPRPPILIASGGLRTTHHMALALALGADLVSCARPVLWAALGDPEELPKLLRYYREGLRSVMLLCGCRQIPELRNRLRRRGGNADLAAHSASQT